MDNLISLPKGMFSTQRRGGPQSKLAGHYPTHEASILTLDHVLEYLMVTKYQLSGLLGIGSRSDMGKWWRAARRPSSMYLIRILQLVFMQIEGIQVYKMRSIDWNNSIIYWRDGSVTRPGDVPQRGGAVPAEVGQADGSVAQAAAERPRQDGALPRWKADNPEGAAGPVY